MALDLGDVLARLDLNGPTATGISTVSDLGLASGNKLPVGVARGTAAPEDRVYPAICATILKYWTPDIDLSQQVPEQPRHVCYSIVAAFTMAKNGWLADGEATWPRS